MVLKIFPLPVVTQVRPRLGHVSGNRLITVLGQHFGSEYSRGYLSAEYRGVAVYVGGQRCLGERIVSDEAITCTVPTGVGTSDVTVNISDAGLPRGGRLVEGYDHSVVYYGGSLTGAMSAYAGFVGMGPRAGVSVALQPFVQASMQVTLVLMYVMMHAGYATGSLFHTSVLPTCLFCIVCLLACSNFIRNKSIIFNQPGSNSSMVIHVFDCKFDLLTFISVSSQWQRGRLLVSRSILAMVALRDKVVLGGSFQTAENITVNHICDWDGDVVKSWGGGVDGTVNALSPFMGGILVGGAFTRAASGGRSVSTGGLALWRHNQWQALGGAQILGVVFSILANSSRVYVAGKYSSLGPNVPVSLLPICKHAHSISFCTIVRKSNFSVTCVCACIVYF